MFLLDTNIVSELRRVRPHGGVLAFVRATPAEELRVSAVTFGKLQEGVELLRAGNPEKAAAIDAWIDELSNGFEVLPMEIVAFRAFARLAQKHPGAQIEDTMIAATALVHGLTVVTRNVRDFRRFGLPIVNPFEAARG